jgi:hypothetical protein
MASNVRHQLSCQRKDQLLHVARQRVFGARCDRHSNVSAGRLLDRDSCDRLNETKLVERDRPKLENRLAELRDCGLDCRTGGAKVRLAGGACFTEILPNRE